MSRVRKVVASEGKGSTPQKESGSDSKGNDTKLELMMEKLMVNIEEKFQETNTRFEEQFSGFDKRLDEMKERLTRREQSRSAGQAGVQTEEVPETSTRRHGASKVGVTQDTPQTGTQMLKGKGQPSTGRHGEEQDQVSALRPGFRDEKGSEPGGESIQGGPSNPSEPKPLEMYQQQSGRHDEIHCSIVRPSEGDHNRDACPAWSAIRDPLCGEGLDVEPVQWSTTGFEDGEKPVKQEEATTASPNIEQGWRNSSKVAVVYATTTTTKRTVQQRHVLRNRTGVKTTEENKFFDPGGKQVVANKTSEGKVVARWSMHCIGAIEAGSTRTSMPSIYASGQAVHVCIALGG